MTLFIFWTPDGITLDSIREKKFVDISDGDSIKIEMPVRMLSVDTPEKSVTKTRQGLSKRDMHTLMDPLADWIESGQSPVQNVLAQHLVPRIRRPDMAEIHWAQGESASDAHKDIVDERLTKPNGKSRSIFVRVADERFDRHGRLLAYLAPSYTAEERKRMPRRERATFNFSFLESGWSASFIIYPSIPGEKDLPMVQAEGKAAIEEGRGQWADSLTLAGYEYRMVEALTVLFKKVRDDSTLDRDDWTGWISRYCADMETGFLYPPQAYTLVRPWNRIFLWRDQVGDAVGRLNLRPAPELTTET